MLLPVEYPRFTVVDIDYSKTHLRLRWLRARFNLKLTDVAEDLAAHGLTRQVVGDMEQNRKSSTLGHFVKLASFYGTTTDYLAGVPWCNNPRRDPWLQYEIPQLIPAYPAREIVHPNAKEMHHRMRSLRMSLDLTLKDVVEQLGDNELKEQNLGRIEMNTTPLAICHYIYLAGYYGTTLDWLLGVPWCNCVERSALHLPTLESLKAVEIIDGCPRPVRDSLVSSVASQAQVFSRLVEKASQNIKLRIGLQEARKLLTDEQWADIDAMADDRAMQLIAGSGEDGIDFF